MAYTVDGIRYEGITKLNKPSNLEGQKFLVIVWFEGEHELWVCKDRAVGLHAIRQIYEIWQDRYTTIQVLVLEPK